MLSKPITVAIVDDHTLFRKTLKEYISGNDNINVVIQSEDVLDFLSKVKSISVQALLLDLYLPKLSGIEAVRLIKSEYPNIKILIVSMCTDISLLNELLDVGVYGIISKADEPEELIKAIISVAEQRIYRNRLFTEVMYWSKQNDIKMVAESSNVYLNEREKEVLRLLWEEKSNKEIASHLFMSVRSVEKTRQDMKEKLGIKSTVGLLKYALRE